MFIYGEAVKGNSYPHKVYVFHNDPGHGWLAVKRKELESLGLLDTISSYSYTKGATVYLEEDCDMSAFISAKKAVDEPVIYKNSFTDHSSPIRNYERYYKPFNP